MIEASLKALPGILDARVIELQTSGAAETEGPLCKVAYLAGPGAIGLAADAIAAQYGLDAVVPVNRLGSDAELAALPVWTEAAIRRLTDDLAAEPGIEEVAVVAMPAGARRLSKRSRLVPQSPASDSSQSDRPEGGAERPTFGEPLSDRPAVVHGRPLEIPAGHPRTLGEALARAAESGKGSVSYGPDGGLRREGYDALYRRALVLLGGLRASGLEAGDIVLLDTAGAGDFIGAFWACVLGGIVPAPIALPAPGSDPDAFGRLDAAWRLLDRPPLVSGHQPPETVLGNGGAGETIQVLDPRRLAAAPAAETPMTADPADTAVIFLTSGSSGTPKGVHQSHQAILSMVAAAIVDGLGLGSDDVFFNWMPLDHVGAIAFHTVGSVVLGCTQVYADTGHVLADPSRWLDIVAAQGVTATWAPNFAFALIAGAVAATDRSWDLSRLKVIVNGGEAVTEESLEDFVHVLAPYGLAGSDVFVPSFGMSETCTAISIGTLGHARGPFTSLGHPTAGSSFRITDDDDRILKEGEIGRFEVAGPQLLRMYHGNPDRDRPAKRDGWFDTGDAGFVADGELYLTGRMKETININGATVFAHEIEAVAAAVPGIDRAGVAAVPVRPNGASTDQVALFFANLPVPGAGNDGVVRAQVRALRSRIARRLGLAVDYFLPIPRQAFPRTGIGKIVRKTLKEEFEADSHAALCERIAGLLGGPDHVDLPLHRRIWVARRGTEASSSYPAPSLVFTADSRLGDELASRGTKIAFPDDPTAALDTLGDDLPGSILVHAVGCASASADAYRSLLDLARTIQALPAERRPATVLAVTTGAVGVGEGEPVVADRALVPGLIRSLGLDMPAVRWRAVDLDDPTPETIAGIASHEIAQGAEPLVAWRAGERLVARFETVVPPSSDRPLEDGTPWLITGGLGGLGRASCEWLLSRGAPVLLVGRSDPATLAAERAEALDRLRSLGRVRYAALDVGDADTLGRAVEAFEQEIGRPLAGMLHMAGTGRAITLAEEDDANLATMKRASLDGLASLDRLLRCRPDARLLVAGSIVGQIGGRVAGYAAVQAALAEAARGMIAAGVPLSYLAFASWLGIGMSEGQTSETLVRADGLVPLDTTTGILAIEAALRRPGSDWLVGLDETHPLHAAFVDAVPMAATRPVAWIRGGTADGADCKPDALGRPGWILTRSVAEIPRDHQGRPDVARLASDDSRGCMAPRNETERRVAAIFGQVLASDPPAINDDFFVAGGTSLSAVQLAARLSDLFFVDLPVGAVFQNPTVESMTRQLRALEAEPGMTDAVARHMAEIEAAQPTGEAS